MILAMLPPEMMLLLLFRILLMDHVGVFCCELKGVGFYICSCLPRVFGVVVEEAHFAECLDCWYGEEIK